MFASWSIHAGKHWSFLRVRSTRDQTVILCMLFVRTSPLKSERSKLGPAKVVLLSLRTVWRRERTWLSTVSICSSRMHAFGLRIRSEEKRKPPRLSVIVTLYDDLGYGSK